VTSATYTSGKLPIEDLGWDVPLHPRRDGAKVHLAGIAVYHEFPWRSQFRTERTQFPRGQCLSEFVKECAKAAGKTPVLLLTVRPEIDDGLQETPDMFVYVLNLPRYLAAPANPFLSYVARTLGGGIFRVDPKQAARREDVIQEVLDSQITREHIEALRAVNPQRLEQLRELTATDDASARRATPDETIAGLITMHGLDADAVTAITQFFSAHEDRDRLIRLLQTITDDPNGRYVVGEVLAAATPQRIEDAHASIEKYQALLDDPAEIETGMQKFLEDNPWILGLDYARIRPRQQTIRGAVDFLMERFDGFHDLLELKSPNDPIIEVKKVREEGAASASNYRVSDSLGLALGQVHAYRDVLSHDEVHLQQFGLPDTRDPRVIIVIGNVDALPADRFRVLRELNKSLHRVEIVGYDVLAKRARAMLENVERYLRVQVEEAEEEAEAASGESTESEA
jgi:hypothetical protein